MTRSLHSIGFKIQQQVGRWRRPFTGPIFGNSFCKLLAHPLTITALNRTDYMTLVQNPVDIKCIHNITLAVFEFATIAL